MHNHVYGVCESKCFVEVSPKSATDAAIASTNATVASNLSNANGKFDTIFSHLIIANDGSQWLVNNAAYNTANNTWTRVDTTKAATAVHLSVAGNVELFNCAAGAGNITWSPISIDLANLYSSTGNINMADNKLIGGKFTLTGLISSKTLMFYDICDEIGYYIPGLTGLGPTQKARYRIFPFDINRKYGIRMPNNITITTGSTVYAYACGVILATGAYSGFSETATFEIKRRNSSGTTDTIYSASGTDQVVISYAGYIVVHSGCQIWFEINNAASSLYGDYSAYNTQHDFQMSFNANVNGAGFEPLGLTV